MNSQTTKPDAERDKDPDRSREEEAAPAFRVIDRRRFAADGTERNEAGEAPPEEAHVQRAPRPDQPAAPPPRPQPPEARAPIGAGAAPPPAEDTMGMPIGDAYDDRHIPTEPTFSTLIISLSTQALMLLGEIVEPGQEHPIHDLPAAKHMIDLLGVLEKKTSGNLDAAEASLLERILFDLRMRFVELARKK